jgi:hypothetical protein
VKGAGLIFKCAGGAARAADEFACAVIPNEVRNPSGFETQEKGGFLTSFGMTAFLFCLAAV